MNVSPPLRAKPALGKTDRWIGRISLALSPFLCFAAFKWGGFHDCFSGVYQTARFAGPIEADCLVRALGATDAGSLTVVRSKGGRLPWYRPDYPVSVSIDARVPLLPGRPRNVGVVVMDWSGGWLLSADVMDATSSCAEANRILPHPQQWLPAEQATRATIVAVMMACNPMGWDGGIECWRTGEACATP